MVDSPRILLSDNQQSVAQDFEHSVSPSLVSVRNIAIIAFVFAALFRSCAMDAKEQDSSPVKNHETFTAPML